MVDDRPVVEERTVRTDEITGEREIRKVPVVPFALITATIMAIWTLILAVIAAIIGGALLSTVPMPVNGGQAATGGIVGIIISIILSFIGTFIFSAITAAIYNVLAPRIGGIKIDLW